MAIRGIFSKKKKLGFSQKQRTKEEINTEYNHHAVMVGHITRVISQQEETRSQHLAALVRLNDEGMKLPPEDTKKETQPEGPTE